MTRAQTQIPERDASDLQGQGLKITEVRIRLAQSAPDDYEQLQGFCSITFDDMSVINDLKIIAGAKGFFVAMPSRKLTDRCNHCGTKNHSHARFCNQCGSRLNERRAPQGVEGSTELYAEVTRPISPKLFEKIQTAALLSFADELERTHSTAVLRRYDDREDADDPIPITQETPGLEPARARVGSGESVGITRSNIDRHPDSPILGAEMSAPIDLPRSGEAGRCVARVALRRFPDSLEWERGVDDRDV